MNTIDLFITTFDERDFFSGVGEGEDVETNENHQRERLKAILANSCLSEDERQRVSRFCFLKDQCRSLISRQLLRNVLGNAVGSAPEDLEFAYGDHGKPYLADMPNLPFNLSHSGDQIVLALSRATGVIRLGVDIEGTDSARDPRKLAQRFFSRREVVQIQSIPQDDPESLRLLFSQLWSLKEAFIKALGRGLSLPLKQFGFDVSPIGTIDFHCDDDIDVGLLPWSFHCYSPRPKLTLALASQAGEKRISVRWHEYCTRGTENGFTIRELPDEETPSLVAGSVL